MCSGCFHVVFSTCCPSTLVVCCCFDSVICSVVVACRYTIDGPLIRGQNAIQALYDWAQTRFQAGGPGPAAAAGEHHFVRTTGALSICWRFSGVAVSIPCSCCRALSRCRSTVQTGRARSGRPRGRSVHSSRRRGPWQGAWHSPFGMRKKQSDERLGQWDS